LTARASGRRSFVAQATEERRNVLRFNGILGGYEYHGCMILLGQGKLKTQNEGARTMKRQYKVNDGFGGTYTKTVELPFVVVSESLDAQYYEVQLWGLASFVKEGANGLACFGWFRRNGRHVTYCASVERDADGTLYHDPVSEMWDDISYLRAGQVEWWK
jgi:hypothetical protein